MAKGAETMVSAPFVFVVAVLMEVPLETLVRAA
jgi:hypothetical protein